MRRVINLVLLSVLKELRIYARHLRSGHPENFHFIINAWFRFIIKKMNSIIIPQVFFAIIVQAGQIKYTCEQAELYCNDGHFIPQENVCETYPDDIG